MTPAKGRKVSKSKELVEVVVVAVENVPSSIVDAELDKSVVVVSW
jgi:hypothetical protein